jgi:hypothetical protein
MAVCGATHRWKNKVGLQPDTLHVMSPKKGETHANLPPRLKRSFIPSDASFVDLLEDECPVAMWRVYFDGCNASEEEAITGDNKPQGPGSDSWDHLQCPSHLEIERANNFKTPERVWLHLDLKMEVKEEPFWLDTLVSRISLGFHPTMA